MTAKVKISILVIAWSATYLGFLAFVMPHIDAVNHTGLYLAALFSYSLVSIPIAIFTGDDPKKQRVDCFFIPFLFGVFLVSLFMVGMALTESYPESDILAQMKMATLVVLPYSFKWGALFGLPLGFTGYLLGGLTGLAMRLGRKK